MQPYEIEYEGKTQQKNSLRGSNPKETKRFPSFREKNSSLKLKTSGVLTCFSSQLQKRCYYEVRLLKKRKLCHGGSMLPKRNYIDKRTLVIRVVLMMISLATVLWARTVLMPTKIDFDLQAIKASISR